eukprot:34459_2
MYIYIDVCVYIGMVSLVSLHNPQPVCFSYQYPTTHSASVQLVHEAATRQGSTKSSPVGSYTNSLRPHTLVVQEHLKAYCMRPSATRCIIIMVHGILAL